MAEGEPLQKSADENEGAVAIEPQLEPPAETPATIVEPAPVLEAPRAIEAPAPAQDVAPVEPVLAPVEPAPVPVPVPVPTEPAPAPAPAPPPPKRPLFGGALGGVARFERAAEELAARVGFALLSWAGEVVLQAIAIGAAVYWFRFPERLGAIDHNKLTPDERVQGTMYVAFAMAALLVAHLIFNVAGRVQRGRWAIVESSSRLARWLRFTLALPIVAALRAPKVEHDKPVFTLFMISLAAIAMAAWGYGLRPRPEPAVALDEERGARVGLGARLAATLARVPDRARGALAGVAVAGLWGAYGWFFSRLALVNHIAGNTRTTDLGYYDNIFWQSVHGNFLGCSFIKAGYHGSAHFDPILVLVSPLYLLHPNAEFLLTLQSVWLGAGVVPAYLLARLKLGGRLAPLAFAACLAAYPAMHGANMYEFHSLTLAAPLILWALYLFEAGHIKRYYAVLFFALLVREDIALVMCFVGTYAIITRRAGATRVGITTIAASVLYFAIVKKFFMTSPDIFMSGKEAYGFAYYYDAMIPDRKGMGGLFMSLVLNPVFTIKNALTEEKLIFLAQLFVPLALLPFFARRARFMLVYGFFFLLLASRSAVFSIAFQYSTVMYPIAFALVPMTLADIRSGSVGALGWEPRRLARALFVAMLAATALTSWKYGAFVENSAFKGGFLRVSRTITAEQLEHYRWLRATAALIPKDARVGTSNRLGTHVSNRSYAVFYPEATDVDWIFLDEGELKAPELEKLRARVKRDELREVVRKNKLALYEVVAPNKK